MSKTDKQTLKVSLQAGSVELGELLHPNKMPFAGILTYFEIPSDKPVGGAGGKRVIIPAEYGIPALESLKGMAVDFDPLLMDKHVPKHKIGIIEDAWIGDRLDNGGLPVHISGYVFAHDFPEEAQDIKNYQSDLGFSYETIDTPVMDVLYEGEAVLRVCDEMVFSGAAILLAEKAAFTTTSLAAQADEQEQEGNNLELDQIIAAVIATMEAKFELKTKAQQDQMQEVMEQMVESHMEAENAMAQLCAEGEEKLEEKVEGEQNADLNAEAEKVEEKVEDTVVDNSVDKVVDKVEEHVEEKDLNAEAEVKEEVQTVDFQAMTVDLQAQLEAMKAELEQAKADLKAETEAKEQNSHKGFDYPMTLAAKYNLKAEADTYEAQIAEVDAREDLSTEQRMALKFELRNKHLNEK